MSTDANDCKLPFGARVTGYLLTAAYVFAPGGKDEDTSNKDIFEEARRHVNTYYIISNSVALMKVGVIETGNDIKRYEAAAAEKGVAPEALAEDSEYIALLNENDSRADSLEANTQSLKSYVRGIHGSLNQLYDYILWQSEELEARMRVGDAGGQVELVEQFYDGLWKGTFGVTAQQVQEKEILPDEVVQDVNDAWDILLDKFRECWHLNEKIGNLPEGASEEALQPLLEQLDGAQRKLNLSALQSLDEAVGRARSMLPPADELAHALSDELEESVSGAYALN